MKNNRMRTTRIMLDFKVKRKYRRPIRDDKNITGRIFLCGLWNQSHEINTSHSHLSHLLIYTILTKSNSFAIFFGGGGINIQDSRQTDQPSYEGITVVVGQHPRVLRQDCTVIAPSPRYPLAPTPRLVGVA